jgi:hypothetical protein
MNAIPTHAMRRRLGAIALWLSMALGLAGCGGGAGDGSVPPGSSGPPAQPAATTTVEIVSDSGDPIGQGRAYRYSAADARIGFNASSRGLGVRIAGNEQWAFDVELPFGALLLAPLRLTGMGRLGAHDPLSGGLLWSGEGRSCGRVRGTIEVENITFRNGELRSIEVRFEQFCDGSGAALRGFIRWVADDSTGPRPPQNPPPADLWRPPPGAVPARGNYFYLESRGGDPVGLDLTFLFTDTNAPPIVTVNGRRLRVSVGGPVPWLAEFDPGVAVVGLVVGFVGSIAGPPLGNPVTGGLHVTNQGRGCERATGWFVVDRVLFVDGLLSEIELRFSQQCEGSSGVLRGQLRWHAVDAPRS